jgi:ArsR family transcriptional regulator
MKELEQYFKALGDVSRLRILNLLLHGELCVCDIQYVLETSQPNVSRHLAYLKNSGLVSDRRDGFRIFYRLAEPRQSPKKRLFELVQESCKNEEQLQQDTRRLKQAIENGSCTVSDWKPFAAMSAAKPPQTHRS